MPNELYDLTPRQLEKLIEGYQFRFEREMEKTAWLAANLMQIHTKKKITIRKLLGNIVKRNKEKPEISSEKLEIEKEILMQLAEKSDGEKWQA